MKISQSAVAMKSSSSYSHYQESKVTSILVRPGELEAAKKARQERLNKEADKGVDVSISDELQNSTSFTILNLQNSPGLSSPHYLNSLSTANDSSTYYFAIKHPDSDHSALKIYTNTGDTDSTSGANSKIILEPNAAYGVLGTADAPWAIYGSEAYFKSNVFA